MRNLTAMAKTASDTAKTMSMLLGAIASISLLVGGIGIMNIMFVSVTERTKEIGTMKAIGAKNADIMKIFIFESGIFGLVGGILGAIFGLFLSWIVSFIANNYTKTNGCSIYN